MTETKPTTFTCEQCGQEKPRKSMKGPVPKRCEECKATNKEAATRDRVNKLREEEGRELLPAPELTQAEVDAKLDAEAAAVEADEEQAAAENEAAVEPIDIGYVPPAEETWLDGDEAQELLRQKREAEIGSGVTYNPEVHGSVQEFIANVNDLVDRRLVAPTPELEAAMGEVTTESVGVMLENLAEREGIGAHAPDPDIISPAALCVAPGCEMPNPPHVGLFCDHDWQRVGLDDRNLLLSAPPNSEPFVTVAHRVVVKLRAQS